jgi:hypothetical protein
MITLAWCLSKENVVAAVIYNCRKRLKTFGKLDTGLDRACDAEVGLEDD